MTGTGGRGTRRGRGGTTGGRGTGGTGPTDQGKGTQRQTLAETEDQKPDNKTNGLEVPKILIIQYVPYEAYSILFYNTQNGF